MKRAASLVPDLYAVHADYALSELCKDEQKLERVLLSREFHVSLGRPVAIQVHQIDSFIAMLRQKFQSQQRLVILKNFILKAVPSAESSRTVRGLGKGFSGRPYPRLCNAGRPRLEPGTCWLQAISKQILMVDEVYRLHGLPEFYKNPRPYISLVWALGDISCKMKQAIKDIEKYQSSMSSSQKCNIRCKFNRVICKVGKKMYDICKLAD
ncbi:hypothetical protein PR202_ga02160 [Eleusine coracana subsp. coracana]|uniref:U6 snRNA phosphodiesterase 1 n=1 Tax=Eleusine coracana subsp. coracana TaxID=191504 RepID=A0AAV5BIP9_ELECO|nr:hypothetical protein PR202_ga02160 [Eleusine coracana subsp. coracana]